ncbi:MAG: BBP7 family outer membrane beta-barrel protein [Pirellulaceae bacterium]
MSRSFFGLEYLHWWNKGRSLPPLVTGGPTGILPQSPILFGNQDVGGGLQAGGRLTAGLWLDDCKESAVVLRAFANEGDNTPFAATTGDTPILAVPFNDTFGLPGPNSIIVGNVATNTVPGAISASASNDVLGGDIYYRTRLDSGCDFRIDLLGGFQYSRIDDDLVLATASPGGGGTAAFSSRDLFEASNKFAAGELGLLGELNQGPVTIQMMGKIGLGNMQQKVAISGTGLQGNTATPGGIFAQNAAFGFPFNGGVHERDVLAWSPEASVKLIWELRDNVSITVGYTFLYWTNVALAGDHVDTSINAPVIFGGAPNANNPTFAFQDTDFWVQTIDIGFAVRY